jgi:hypothetical protein
MRRVRRGRKSRKNIGRKERAVVATAQARTIRTHMRHNFAIETRNGSRGEDRASFFKTSRGFVAVIADGAGGTSGGAEAATQLCELARDAAKGPTTSWASIGRDQETEKLTLVTESVASTKGVLGPGRARVHGLRPQLRAWYLCVRSPCGCANSATVRLGIFIQQRCNCRQAVNARTFTHSFSNRWSQVLNRLLDSGFAA